MSGEITYAVGDVHGRADLLQAVVDHALDDAASNRCSPRFVFLGDICDKGPRSRQAYDIVCEVLADHPTSRLLRGNHDEWFLNGTKGTDRRMTAGWLSRGGIATLESYLAGDPAGALELVSTMHADHVRLLDAAESILVDNDVVYAHAGIDPHKRLSAQCQRDLMWIREPFLDHVGCFDRPVVHGHSVVGNRPVVTENRVSVDTGAWQSGRLTVAACSFGEFRFFQTDGCAGRIVDVEPILVDRGLGTVMDKDASDMWRQAA